jgi:tetratricopeptide (TPR) repeat protein
MKWLMYLVLAALVGGSWLLYSNKGSEMAKLEAQIVALEDAGDLESKAPELKTEFQSIEGERTFNGILLAFLSAGLVGIFFVLQILPAIAQRLTHSVYDSAEMVERDVMHDARSLKAQGEYQGAIAAFQQAAAADPLNRLPWVEIAKIQKDNLGDPAAAIETIRYALESQAWESNDAAYFLFRLAELYDQINGDRDSAIAIMNQVIEQFPGTRHSANASHKIHDWSVAANEAAAAAEEQAYLEQMHPTAEVTEAEESPDPPHDPERPI